MAAHRVFFLRSNGSMRCVLACAVQILQMSRPPSLPPIFEISRPELKLAGGAAADKAQGMS